MPGTSYRFVLGSLGGRQPLAWLAGGRLRLDLRLRFDYRAVLSSGEIESEEWFGPSSAGGLNALAGLQASYRWLVMRAEYTFTYYYFTFSEGLARMNGCQPAGTCQHAAGGATDLLHGFTLSLPS